MIRFEVERRWDIVGSLLSLFNFDDPTAWSFKSVKVTAVTVDGGRWPLQETIDLDTANGLAATYAEQVRDGACPVEWAVDKGFADLAEHLRHLNLRAAGGRAAQHQELTRTDPAD